MVEEEDEEDEEEEEEEKEEEVALSHRESSPTLRDETSEKARNCQFSHKNDMT